MKKWCLVTTSLKEFIPNNENILFLSEGCKVSFSEEELKSLNYKMADFIWNDVQETKSAIKFCTSFYNKVLPIITQELNEIHNTKYNEHYFHIVLGNWLQHYIHVLYDKYITLKNIQKRYENIETILPLNQNFIPLDYSDFVSKCFSSDQYNLQIYSDIIKLLSFNYKEQEIIKPLNNSTVYKKNINIKRKVFNYLNGIFQSINKTLKNDYLLLTDTYFKYDMLKNILKIFINGKLKFLFNDLAYEYDFKVDFQKDLRQIKVLNFKENEFEKIFSRLFFNHIPWLFLEGFHPFKNYIINLPILKPKVIFSANGIHGNYILKFYLAEYYQDIKFLYIMHGGYGFEQYNTPEEYEISCADQYYSIGTPQRANLKHLPYMGFKKNTLFKSKNHILYAISEMSRYVYRIEFHAMSNSYLKYNLNWTKKVLSNLDSKIHIKLRMQSADNSFNSLSQLQESRPTIEIDDFSRNFDEELKECKLYITNNIATTFLESMTLNKPTIVMVSKNVYLFRDISQPYMDMLAEVKILHYSEDSVIEHINRYYESLDDWWLSNNVQNARKKFLDMFMKDNENWINDWIEEFKRNL